MKVIGRCLLAALFCMGGHGYGEPAGGYPDPARYQGTIDQFLAGPQPPAGGIVAVGSSSMRMWHPTIAADLAPLTIVPRGFGGSNMNDLLHHVDALVIRNRPRAVMIYEGDNDANLGIAPGEIVGRLNGVISRVRAQLPAARIYLLSVKPSPSRWHIWPQMQETNRLFRELADGDPLITFIDIGSGMLTPDGQPRPEIFLADRLHMNDLGYRAWTAAVQPVLMAGEARFEAPVGD